MKGTLDQFWHRESRIKESGDDGDDNEEEGKREEEVWYRAA